MWVQTDDCRLVANNVGTVAGLARHHQGVCIHRRFGSSIGNRPNDQQGMLRIHLVFASLRWAWAKQHNDGGNRAAAKTL